MENITFALYKGKEYSAGLKKDGTIVLRSSDSQDLNNGFNIKEIGRDSIFIKYVQRNEVEEIYNRRMYANYAGFEFAVVREKDDMICIMSLGGNYKDWLNLGMEYVDKGVYEKWIPKEDAKIKIVKKIYTI